MGTEIMEKDLPSYEQEVADCDAIFANILKTIHKRRGYVVNVQLLVDAYKKARELHGRTRRKSGVLYLRHPLAVMEELSHLMCKTSVLAAALLHDTMEDCNMTYEAIRRDFSGEIAEIVSAVTAIKVKEMDPDYIASLDKYEQHDYKDRLTDAKLISTPYQREAFLVRFADRAHNLSTIDACSPGKRKEKIASTRQFLIPAARMLGMRYFEIILSNFCMEFDGEEYEDNESARICQARNALTRVGGGVYSRFDQILEDALDADEIFSYPRFNPFAQLRGVREEGEDWMMASPRRVMLAYEIRRQLPEGGMPERSKVDLWEVILTCKEEDPRQILQDFLNLYRRSLQPQGLFFEYLGQEDSAVIVRLTDPYENNYRVVLVPDDGLEAWFIGNPKGEKLTMIDEEAPGDALRPQITVYSYSSRKGYRKYDRCIPFGATALDFAFIINPDLAYTVKDARIHTWKPGCEPPEFSEDDYKYPLKTELNDGDVVHFDADYVPKLPGIALRPGQTQSILHATIDWFAQINTEYAKMCLIRYFKDELHKLEP